MGPKTAWRNLSIGLIRFKLRSFEHGNEISVSIKNGNMLQVKWKQSSQEGLCSIFLDTLSKV